MYPTFLHESRFYELLFRIDEDLAQRTRQGGCPHCGGELHSANYLRKPRGTPQGVAVGPSFALRHSFCCSREGCRCRQQPPSVRFFGRRVYLTVFVALLTALRQGASPHTARQLKRDFGVDRRTLARWRRWWQQSFPATPFWRRESLRVIPPLAASGMPKDLIEHFLGESLIERVLSLLRFLAPLDHASCGSM